VVAGPTPFRVSAECVLVHVCVCVCVGCGCAQVLRRGMAAENPCVLLAVSHTTVDALRVLHGARPGVEDDKVPPLPLQVACLLALGMPPCFFRHRAVP
jgi:hypothetical protein